MGIGSSRMQYSWKVLDAARGGTTQRRDEQITSVSIVQSLG